MELVEPPVKESDAINGRHAKKNHSGREGLPEPGEGGMGASVAPLPGGGGVQRRV